MRNPPWLRDEAILALDLYISSGRRVLDKRRNEVIELAKILNRLRRKIEPDGPQEVRTSGSVAAKLANFRALDPSSSSQGFSNIAKVDRDVWKEFADDEQRLREAVMLIHSSMNRHG